MNQSSLQRDILLRHTSKTRKLPDSNFASGMLSWLYSRPTTTSQFSETTPAYAARSGNFETFLEIFSTLFCKNWRESPWKHSISEKQECHAGEEISNSCFFKVGDEKF